MAIETPRQITAYRIGKAIRWNAYRLRHGMVTPQSFRRRNRRLWALADRRGLADQVSAHLTVYGRI